jgi:hypothetical protein
MNPIEVQKIRRNNLRRFIEDKFDGSVNAFAKYIARPASFFYDALSGKWPLGEKIMRYIEETFNLIRYELDRTDDGSFEHRRFELIKVFSKELLIHKLDGINFPEDNLDVLPVSLENINRLSWDISDLFWVKVDDNSMEPKLSQGSSVLVYRQYKELVNGKIYVVRAGNSVLIRRIFIDNISKSIILQPENHMYPRASLLLDMLYQVEIVGRALVKSAEDL